MTTTEVSFADKCTLRCIYWARELVKLQNPATEWVNSPEFDPDEISHLVEVGLMECRQVDHGGDEYRITQAGIEAIADDLTHDRVCNIAFRVASATHLRTHWIARQQNKAGEWTGWAFAVGSGAPFFSNEDLATRTDEELYAQAFTEVMGYAPDSTEDLQARIERSLNEVDSKLAQVKGLEEEIEVRLDHINGLRRRLEEMTS